MSWSILVEDNDQWSDSLTSYGYDSNLWESVHDALETVAQIETEHAIQWRVINNDCL